MKTYKYRINGNEYDVEIASVDGNIANVTVNGTAYQVELENAPAVPAQGAGPGKTQPSPAQDPGSAGNPAATAPAAKPAGSGKAVTSPLPGVVIEVSVKEGQAVKAGQKIAVIEAMKMENEIPAPADGTITAVLVGKGDSVLEGAEIVKIG